jgi:hypothetical protein
VTRPASRIAAFGLALLAAASIACVKRRNEPLGGNWYIVWEMSQIPEAGGTHPHLYRKRFPFGRRIEENTWRYRYLGDDCVLNVAGNSDRGELLAACGDHPPVVVADHMDDYVKGYAGDTGITGDPVSINGTSMSVSEIKARAGHGS